jgi:two-component system chemotaxis response regulator CheB
MTPLMRHPKAAHRALVIGCSAGGLSALGALLPALPAQADFAVLVAYHLCSKSDEGFKGLLQPKCPWQLGTAMDKLPARAGEVVFAPARYHLLVEPDGTLALSVEEACTVSIPAIDLLFESAAECWGPDLVAMVLTGANRDGAMGAEKVVKAGGTVLIEDPATAEFPLMPESCLRTNGLRLTGNLCELKQVIQDPFDSANRTAHLRTFNA